MTKAVSLPPHPGVPWAAKPIVDLPANLVSAGKAPVPEIKSTQKITTRLSSGIDENGWKTIKLESTNLDTAKSQALASDKPFAQTPNKPPALPLPPLMSEEEAAVQRILGISPSMNDLVKDFEHGNSASHIGTQLIKVNTGDELAEQLRNMAKGKEGPFLLIFSHNRVRLMGLKTEPVSDNKK